MPIQTQLMSAGLPAGTAQALNRVATFALAGSTQSDGTKITAPTAIFTSGSGSAVLPTPNAGDVINFVNVSGNTGTIFPASGGTINALSQDASISIATAKSCLFVAQSGTQWRTIPLVPS